MSKDIISRKTRLAFREYLVANSTLRGIREGFESADVPVDRAYDPPTSGERRSLIEKYYHGVDWSSWEDIRKVLPLFSRILVDLRRASVHTPSPADDKFGFSAIIALTAENARRHFESLRRSLKQDGFEYKEGKIVPVGRGQEIATLSKITARFDMPELRSQIERLYRAVDEDPALAIGTAKELVETACKTILTEKCIEIDASWDLGELVGQTRKALGLLPKDVPDAAKGADTIRKVLGNLGGITQGLGDLRNRYGTGHGKHGRARGLSPRHARLAVGAASTLATFLFETHAEEQKGNA